MYIREEKALWLVAHTITQDESEIFLHSFFFFFPGISITVCIIPLENCEI